MKTLPYVGVKKNRKEISIFLFFEGKRIGTFDQNILGPKFKCPKFLVINA